MQTRWISWIGVGLICIGLVSIKWQSLDLPHYWDEAFPYSYAIGYMTEHGPGLLTTAAPADYHTGHPLLYYFLQASWNSAVGPTLWLQRLLPLIFSILCLLLTFLIGKRFFGKEVGLAATLLLSAQSTFLAQSSFQLPETLLTLLLLNSIYFLIEKRYVIYCISLSLLILVKEPSVILIAILFVYHFFIQLRHEKWIERLRMIWIYIIPVLIAAAFYLHQYVVQGWLLFPRHTGFMGFSVEFMTNQLSRYFSHLFIYSGRNALFFGSVIPYLIYLVVKRKSLRWTDQGRYALLLGLLLVGYLLFSSINFYSNRYILCLFPLFTSLAAAAIFEAFKLFSTKQTWVFSLSILLLSGTGFYFSFTNLKDTDHSLGYANAVRTQKQAIEFCIEVNWMDKPIATGFLMEKNMSSHYPRYISESQRFTQTLVEPNEAEIIIVTSNEKEHLEHVKSEDWKLHKRFEKEQAWSEIYLRTTN